MNCETCRYSGYGWHENECSRPTTECSYQPIEQHKPEERTAERTETHACDCVDRQAVIDALHRYFDGMLETDTWSPCDVYGLIEILPSVPPDIIACGDCKHWICHDRRCGYWNHGVKPLEWCCHAERRTDGKDT